MRRQSIGSLVISKKEDLTNKERVRNERLTITSKGEVYKIVVQEGEVYYVWYNMYFLSDLEV